MQQNFQILLAWAKPGFAMSAKAQRLSRPQKAPLSEGRRTYGSPCM